MKPIRGRTRNIQKAPIQQLLSEVQLPKNVISLGQGIPFFGPPATAVNAAREVLDNPQGFRYTDDAGDLTLREAISNKLQKENRFHADPTQNIMVTCGANQAFINVILAITNPGDKIILFSPVYFNQVMAVKLAGCQPVILGSGEDYLPLLEEMYDVKTEDVKAIVTISPNNPTGAVYPKKMLQEINHFCRDENLYHISDEVYEYFVFNNMEHISPAVFDETLDHTITIFSFSKAFGMAGYRIGYMVIPTEIYPEVLKVQDTINICAPAPSQAAAIAALSLGWSYAAKYYPVFSEIREIFINELQKIDDVILPVTHGGYYFLIKLKTTKSDWEISKYLIEQYGVITIPGMVFNTSVPSLRVSYGNLDRTIAREGLQRLKEGLRQVL